MRGVRKVGAVVALLLGVWACGGGEGEIPIDDGSFVPPSGKATKKQKRDPQAESAEGAPADDSLARARVSFTDDDFVESENNRDPFRSYATTFQVKAPAAPQRLVLMPDVGIDQMRLIAIVTGAERPRAMLVDPSGVGHVATRGDFIGRAEVVQTGGRDSLPVTLNWRVDRIRSSEVVLAREDPSSPNRAPLTRVLSLYDETDIAGTMRQAGEDRGDVPDFSGLQTGG